MSKPGTVPSRIEPSLTQGDERYVIHSRLEIAFILREMMQKNTLVTLYFDRGDDFILTTILGVDAGTGKIVVDFGANAAFNARALRAGKLIFIASHNEARVQFACRGIGKIKFEDRNAFSVDLPDRLLRMQRREYYRITTPAVNPLKCALPLPAGHTPADAEVILVDISCGGIAVIDQHSKVDFEPGTTYEDRRIVLPGVSTLNVTLQVKTVFEVILKNGLAGRRSGCEFVAMQEKMLALVQRYILKLESERKAKQAME